VSLSGWLGRNGTLVKNVGGGNDGRWVASEFSSEGLAKRDVVKGPAVGLVVAGACNFDGALARTSGGRRHPRWSEMRERSWPSLGLEITDGSLNICHV
jgi:hypothetical protein